MHAAAAYRSGASCYLEDGMLPLAAYMRILSAEALLLAEQADEAVSELVRALPVIEREGLTVEAAVSVRLLKQAIEMKRLTPGLLRDVRERLRIGRED